jgi:hypothetical protein
VAAAVTAGDADRTATLAPALDRVFAAAVELIPREGRLVALEVSAGAGQWAEIAARHGMEWLEASVPGEIPVPAAGAGLVFSAGALGQCEAGARGDLIEQLWSALAPGGWLVIVEELMPALELETLIVDGTAGGAILEHFEALRYPEEDLRRTALAVCSKASGTRDPVRVHGLSLSATSPSQQELGYGSRG